PSPRSRSAASAAAPLTPPPFMTRTSVFERVSFGAPAGAGRGVVGAPATRSIAALRTWWAIDLPAIAIPTAASANSSAAARRETRIVAVRQRGVTSAGAYVDSKAATRSSPARSLLCRVLAFLTRRWQAEEEVTVLEHGASDGARPATRAVGGGRLRRPV